MALIKTVKGRKGPCGGKGGINKKRLKFDYSLWLLQNRLWYLSGFEIESIPTLLCFYGNVPVSSTFKTVWPSSRMVSGAYFPYLKFWCRLFFIFWVQPVVQWETLSHLPTNHSMGPSLQTHVYPSVSEVWSYFHQSNSWNLEAEMNSRH